MQGEVSACDRKVKMDGKLQGKNQVLEMKMHTELKKWNSSMRGEKKKVMRCAI